VAAGITVGEDGAARCFWCAGDAGYRTYHDGEWGFPSADDRHLFEKICLEGFQAGLSWLTILRKRDAFRRAFAGFEIEKVARFDARRVARLLTDPGIVRHRAKIESAIHNAKRTLEVVDEAGSLAAFLWRFEPGKKERPRRMTRAAIVKLTETPASRALSRELRGRGFTFVGPTTMYALMQSVGLVNDHLEGCDARPRAEAARRSFRLPRELGSDPRR
jgi:DNA-3-methyladenine glycosylase I